VDFSFFLVAENGGMQIDGREDMAGTPWIQHGTPMYNPWSPLPGVTPGRPGIFSPTASPFGGSAMSPAIHAGMSPGGWSPAFLQSPGPSSSPAYAPTSPNLYSPT
jgi:hypothetical protein